MSLIKCSECGKEYSDKASSCPQCGCPTEYNLESINRIEQYDYDANSFIDYEKTKNATIDITRSYFDKNNSKYNAYLKKVIRLILVIMEIK